MLVALQFEFLELEIEKRLGGNAHLREGHGIPVKLLPNPLHVIEVNVRVPQGMREDARREAALMGGHLQQQGVACDVEGNPERHVRGALVELHVQPPAAYVELEKSMAGRQFHARNVADVPGRNDDAARVGILSDEIQSLLNLIHVLAAVKACSGLFHIARPTAPLIAVDGTQLSVRGSPGVPYRSVLGQIVVDIGASAQEPEQLSEHGVEQDFFGGDERKPFAQIVFGLHAEQGEGSRAGAIFLALPFVENLTQQLVVLAHRGLPREGKKTLRSAAKLRQRCPRAFLSVEAAPASPRKQPKQLA